MAREFHVPALGESVTEATIGKWFKQVGDHVRADEPMVELETDKVTVEVPAPVSGRLTSIAAEPGTTVNVGALLGAIEEGAGGAAALVKKVEAVAARAEAPLSPAVPEPTSFALVTLGILGPALFRGRKVA